MSARFFSSEPLNFGRMSPGVKNLVLANVAVFLVSAVVGHEFIKLFGLVPRQVLQERWVWQPVTYMFVHGGFMHLLFNVFMLWMFGMPIEAQWGTREFLKYYFVCGLSVALVKVLFWPDSPIPLVGASGALFGLLVAFALLYPDSVVYLYFFLPVKAAHMAILCGLIEFFSMLGQGGGRVDDTLPAHGGTEDDGIKFAISFDGDTATVEVESKGEECGMSGYFGGKYVKAQK